METVHVQLTNKRGDIGVFKVLTVAVFSPPNVSLIPHIGIIITREATHARTLENSEVGDITKLSLVLDQEMRC